MAVDHGRGLPAVLAELSELLLEFRGLPSVPELARLRRQRILRGMVEEHGDAGQLVTFGHLVEGVFEHVQLRIIAAVEGPVRGIQGHDLRPPHGALARRGTECGLEVVDLPTHDLVVAGHVDVGDRLIPLLVDDRLRQLEILLRGLVDEVAVDDEQIRLCGTDLLERPPGTLDSFGIRVGGDELGVAHHGDVLRTVSDGPGRQQRRIMPRRGGRIVGLRRGDRLEVGDRNVPLVLLGRPGLHHPDSFEGERLGEPLGDGEADLLPPVEGDVVAVDVRHCAVGSAHLQPRPGPGAVAADHHLERHRVAFQLHRLLRDEVVAARRRGGGEVICEIDARLAIRAGLTCGE